MSEFEEQAALWDEWAATYNESSLGPAAPAARALAELADDGPALELGVGAGRIALPLAQRGIRVLGLDASHEMTRRLLARREDLPVDILIADMAAFEAPCPVALIYIVSSTFYLLTTPERQISCLQSCSRALRADGRLVIEAAVPGTSALPLEEGLYVRAVEPGYAKLSVVAHDPVAQTLRSQEIRLDETGLRMLPVTRRYTHLSELDLMAQAAGLRREARYEGWSLAPYRAGCPRHVSVYSVAGEHRDGFRDR
ncbi:class I SAM-dependent methyltransferase [Streptomyces justiciae]|uniref:Class I SAM-dependent methyltransferase n=1 Tax=Streptomyces justiciae TaxID=2780140 RepID=A0ABU3M646_9ACTN|nr:class I SAM-dependent methyltransferase [Streptomyces justiciae]MDT7846991.1 class I SAM-dependent methyltransferase [Streptomyces justiciae]